MIIQRYIFRELLHRLAWILGLLVLVLTSNRFVHFLADAAEGNLPGDMVFMMLAFKIIATLPKIFPVAILIAMLLAFSRLASDRELIVLYAAGVSRLFPLKLVLQFAVVFSVFVAVTTFYLAPWAEQNIEDLKDLAKQRSDIVGIKPGQFKEFSKGNRVVYVQNPSVDKLAMEDVFLHVRQEGKRGLLRAESARFRNDEQSGNKYIEFNNGRRYVVEPGKTDYRITEFENYSVLTETDNSDVVRVRTAALSTADIFGSDNSVHQAELQWRISLVIACLILPLLSVLLIQMHTREEQRYGPFIIAISIYLIYSNLLGIAQTLIKREAIPGLIGLWWVHILLLVVIAILYYSPYFRHSKLDNTEQQFIPAD